MVNKEVERRHGYYFNMYDILNREPYTFHIHKEACQRKIDKIMANVEGDKKRLNNRRRH